MSLLAIVPSRAGSKGVPGKGLRTVGGIPMILRTLRTVEESGIADELRGSTNCPETASFCQLRGYEVIERPQHLAQPGTPLLPVAKHAAEHEEWTGSVGVFQPTCPLLRTETLCALYNRWTASDLSFAITASDD